MLFRVQQKYLEHKILGQRAGKRDLCHGLFRLLHLYGAAGQQLLAVGAVNTHHKVCRTGGKIAHGGGLPRYACIDHPVVLSIAATVFCVRVCVRHSRQQQGAQAVGGGHAQLVAGRGLRKLAGLLLRHCSSVGAGIQSDRRKRCGLQLLYRRVGLGQLLRGCCQRCE